MARRTYARRYAEAVFQIALAKQDFDGWQADLNRLVGALGDATVARFLENPRFPLADKDRILNERFPGTNPLALNLVRLLISHDNLRALPDIAAEFERLVAQHRGLAPR
jgi:F0F1-type ATP synthase delta subunit